MVAADLTPPEQVAFDQAAEALRLPNAGERASGRELAPGLRVGIEDRAAYGGSADFRLDPPQAGREPSRRICRARGAGWEKRDQRFRDQQERNP